MSEKKEKEKRREESREMQKDEIIAKIRSRASEKGVNEEVIKNIKPCALCGKQLALNMEWNWQIDDVVFGFLCKGYQEGFCCFFIPAMFPNPHMAIGMVNARTGPGQIVIPKIIIPGRN